MHCVSLYGYTTATVSGFVSGITFNEPVGKAIAISLGLEIAGNGEEIIELITDKVSNK